MTHNIIFHHPLPLRSDATTASGIRPLRMLEAFRDLGYAVDVVAGDVSARRAAIRDVAKNIRGGRMYQFMYAESSTMPTALTEPHHLPIAPLLDSRFFGYLKQRRIPIGLFYRDIYWLFDSYDARVPIFKRQVARFFYRHDLHWYDRTLKRLYLPSIEMRGHLPHIVNTSIAELPPGFKPASPLPAVRDANGKLRLLYVGGMSSHYKMHALFEAVARLPQVKLTICTRDSEWEAVKPEYQRWLLPNIEIVHRSGQQMESLYLQCDVAVVFVKPDSYWQFAAPMKIYEYLGKHRPMLASEGTLAGRFVRDKGIGWVIPYDPGALLTQIEKLLENPAEVTSRAQMCARIAPMHTWQTRARQVAEDLEMRE